MYLKDKSKNNWSQFTDHTMTRIRYDDGTEKAFTCGDIVMTFGKHKGKTLAEIDDAGYLRWLAESDNEWQVYMANKRLVELV